AAAMHIDDIGALAMGHDDGASLMDRRHVGEAVERIGLGAGFPALRLVHDVSLHLLWRQASRAPGTVQWGLRQVPGRRGAAGRIAGADGGNAGTGWPKFVPVAGVAWVLG